MYYLVIDSGTTNSRVRLYENHNYIDSVKHSVGAKDVAVRGGDNSELVRSLRELIHEILTKKDLSLDQIEAILAVGMITSNMGLINIPHQNAPVGISDVNLKEVLFYELTDKPILFVPGVRTGKDLDVDVMRGEETEILGYLSEASVSCEALFVHYGSHHKCITVTENKITNCKTSITGELMMSIYETTILKSSLQPLEQLEPNLEWVKEGYRKYQEAGLGNALFNIRTLDTVNNIHKNKTTSFLLGILIGIDVELITNSLSSKTKEIILYGKQLFPALSQEIFQELVPNLSIYVIPEEESDLLSAKGAINIYQYSLKEGRM